MNFYVPPIMKAPVYQEPSVDVEPVDDVVWYFKAPESGLTILNDIVENTSLSPKLKSIPESGEEEVMEEAANTPASIFSVSAPSEPETEDVHVSDYMFMERRKMKKAYRALQIRLDRKKIDIRDFHKFAVKVVRYYFMHCVHVKGPDNCVSEGLELDKEVDARNRLFLKTGSFDGYAYHDQAAVLNAFKKFLQLRNAKPILDSPTSIYLPQNSWLMQTLHGIIPDGQAMWTKPGSVVISGPNQRKTIELILGSLNSQSMSE